MTNTAIKLLGLIVFLASMAPSAYGIGFGASSNGASSNFDIQADESASIAGGFTIDSLSFTNVFSGSGVKKFDHTYTFTDADNNQAVISAYLLNAKKVYLKISQDTGAAEGSETLSVGSADRITCGATATTKEGDTASVDLDVLGGSLTNYVNYANANLINDFGDKTWVASQTADAITGTSITANSKATNVAGTVATSSLVVENGKISKFQSNAGRYRTITDWSDEYGTYSDDIDELSAIQSADAISGTSITASSKTTNAAGEELTSSTTVQNGLISNFKNNASAYTKHHTFDERPGYDYYGTEDTVRAYASQSADTISKIPVVTKGKKPSPLPIEMSLASDASAINADVTASQTASVADGTINGYHSEAATGSDEGIDSSGYTDSNEFIGAMMGANAVTTSNFETQASVTDKDGNTASQTTSVLGTTSVPGTTTGYTSFAEVYSYDYTYPSGDFGSHSSTEANQYLDGAITADDFERQASVTDKDGNTASQTISVLGGTINGYYGGASVGSDSYLNTYGGNTHSSSYKYTEAYYSNGPITADDFETQASVTDKDGNTASQTTSVLNGIIDYYSSGANVHSGSYSNTYSDDTAYSSSWEGTEAYQYTEAITADDFETQASVTYKDGSTVSQTTSVLGGTTTDYNSYAYVDSESYTSTDSSGNTNSGSSEYMETNQGASEITADDFTTASAASSILGIDSDTSLHVTDAGILGLSTYTEIYADPGYDTPDVYAEYSANSVLGSLISADVSSHDQYGNEASATMELTPNTGDTLASMQGYNQEAVTYNPSYPDTIAQIYTYGPATGTGTFNAEATNGLVTEILPTTTVTLTGSTFNDYGEVYYGTPDVAFY